MIRTYPWASKMIAQTQLICTFSAEKLSADQVYAIRVDCPYSDISERDHDLRCDGSWVVILLTHAVLSISQRDCS